MNLLTPVLEKEISRSAAAKTFLVAHARTAFDQEERLQRDVTQVISDAEDDHGK